MTSKNGGSGMAAHSTKSTAAMARSTAGTGMAAHSTKSAAMPAWESYRDSHKGLYQRSDYRGPSGYSYRALQQGDTLQPSYLSRRYRISNPARLRLQAPQSKSDAWIRYGNDVALVNTKDGKVLNIYRDFFNAN